MLDGGFIQNSKLLIQNFAACAESSFPRDHFFDKINRISGTRAGGDSGGAFLQENMGWDSQAVVKRADHAEAEWAFVIEDF